MKRIGLLMGCFNPVHNDHLDLAKTVLNQNRVDEVWFIPAKENLNIKDKKLITSEERLKMLNLAIKGISNCKINPIELNNSRQNYTYETLKSLKKRNNELYLIIGSDNLKTFDKWMHYEEILENHYLIVAPRNGDDVDNILNNNLRLKTYYYHNKIIKLDFNSSNISSTFIRQNINGTKTKSLIPQEIRNYIIEKNLY